MQVQVNTDNHIQGREDLAEGVRATITEGLARFSDRITRVEVHLSDENSHKHGDNDKRCMLEARLSGMRPFAVSHQAPALAQAIEGAIDKLTRALESALGKLDKA